MGDALIVIVLLGLLAVGLMNLFRRPKEGSDLGVPLQNLTQAIQQTGRDTAVLAEKMSKLEPLTGAVQTLNSEMRVLGERVSSIEGTQSKTNLSLAEVRNDLTKTGTNTEGLLSAARTIHDEINRAKTNLAELQAQATARQDLERRTAESVARLESVIAGTQSKGAAGENILEAIFGKLPLEWQERNFAVKGKICEFGLRLPNNRVLPIDSKWAATNLLEQFLACESAQEQVKIKGQIEAALVAKAKEVCKYIDPTLTVGFGVAVVPDAVYDICGSSLYQVFELNVVIVSYSMFIPYLLLVFQTVLKTSQTIDIEKIHEAVQDAEKSIKAVQKELEGRHATALTMLNNSRETMSGEAGKVSGYLASLKLTNISATAPMETSTAQIISLSDPPETA